MAQGRRDDAGHPRPSAAARDTARAESRCRSAALRRRIEANDAAEQSLGASKSCVAITTWRRRRAAFRALDHQDAD
jgi:hypothetical protein